MLHLILLCLKWSTQFIYIVTWNGLQTIAYLGLFVCIVLLKRLVDIILSRRNRVKSTPSKSILITGATSGFGLAMSKFYHRLGFTIFACYYNDKELGYEELKKMNEETGRIHLVFMDVSLPESIHRARKDIDCIMARNSHLRLFCLINNAGISPTAIQLTMTTRSMLQKICDTNFRAQLLTIREFMPLLIKGQGRIVNVSSGLALLPTKSAAAYCATKTGAYQMSRSIQKETLNYGVKTIVVLPGNAIKNTNILCNAAGHFQQAWNEFDKDEKLIYSRLFKKYQQFGCTESDQIRRLREGDKTVKPFDIACLVTLQPQSESTVSPNTMKNSKNSSALANLLTKYTLPLFEKLSGATSSDNLEDDSFMEAFDDAVRSVNPKSILFPGNRWYQFLGPSLLWFPDSLIDYFLSYIKARKERNLDELILNELSAH